MRYFEDTKQTIKVLEFVKQVYKKEHDDFHKFSLMSLNTDCKKDNFYIFLKKAVLMDIQSRPNNLSKYKVLKIFDSLEKMKEDFTEKNLKQNFKNGKEKELLKDIEEKLLSIKHIGHKIAYVIIKNLVFFGDTEKYFGLKREKLLPFLKLPVDIHIRNLLCYRLKLCSMDLYDKISSENKEFQKELKEEICEKSKKLNPIDLDILWYIGYQNCNKRVYCNNCKIKKYCKDLYFEIETRKNIKNKKRIKDKEQLEQEIIPVKNHLGHHF